MFMNKIHFLLHDIKKTSGFGFLTERVGKKNIATFFDQIELKEPSLLICGEIIRHNCVTLMAFAFSHYHLRELCRKGRKEEE